MSQTDLFAAPSMRDIEDTRAYLCARPDESAPDAACRVALERDGLRRALLVVLGASDTCPACGGVECHHSCVIAQALRRDPSLAMRGIP